MDAASRLGVRLSRCGTALRCRQDASRHIHGIRASLPKPRIMTVLCPRRLPRRLPLQLWQASACRIVLLPRTPQDTQSRGDAGGRCFAPQRPGVRLCRCGTALRCRHDASRHIHGIRAPLPKPRTVRRDSAVSPCPSPRVLQVTEMGRHLAEERARKGAKSRRRRRWKMLCASAPWREALPVWNSAALPTRHLTTHPQNPGAAAETAHRDRAVSPRVLDLANLPKPSIWPARRPGLGLVFDVVGAGRLREVGSLSARARSPR